MDELICKLQQLQKKAATATVLLAVFAVLAALVSSFCPPLCVIFIVGVIICCIFTFKLKKEYTLLYKSTIVKSALNEVFDDLEFSPENGLPSSVIFSTEMIERGNRYHSNDLITGKYHHVPFTQSDVCIEEVTTDSKGNTSTRLIFRGRWMIFEFNKNFNWDLQLVSDGFAASRHKGGIFASKDERLNRVKFENEDFNKRFKVYAQNEQEAFYIVTPHLMEALIHLRTGMNAPVMLVFNRGVLHIAVNNHKDAFEAKLFGKVDYENEKNRVLGDIRVITDFVDELAIDRDIYKN